MTVVACFGHWYEQLLYAAPILVVVGLVGVDKIRRRRDDEDQDAELTGGNVLPTSP